MKKTKFLVVLMSAILFLSACGGNNPTPSGDDSSAQGGSQVSSEESSEVSSSEQEKATLTFHTDGGTPIAVVTGEIGEAIDYSKYVTTWEDHDFIGWYGDERASKRKPEEFKEGNQDVYALWSGEIFEGAVDLVYFGRYPSSKVEDKALINEFTTKGEKSSWSSFSSANARYTYEGKSYVEMKDSGVSSYFLEEPLLWGVSRKWNQEEGFYTLKSRQIIDMSWIDPNPRSDAWNNFSISSMFYDLNHGFKNVAFNDLEQNRIDADVTLAESGSAFPGTDYAIYRGAIKNRSDFWYRTPSKNNYYWKMYSDGETSEDLMTNESGVVPEIAVDLRTRSYFTFTFDTNGGTAMEDQFIEVIGDGEVELLECTSTKEGYEFTGYFYDKECTKPFDGHPTESNVTIYLGWAEKVTFTFKFDTNGGTPMEDQVTEGLRGGTVELKECTSTKEGYEFGGYYYDEEYTKPYDNHPTESNVAIYLKWNEKVYQSSVTYQLNISGVTNDESNPTTIYSNVTYELHAPINNNNQYYEFDTWCLDAALTQPVTELKGIKENIHLYAKWNKTNWALFYCDYLLQQDDTYTIIGFRPNQLIEDLVIPDTYNGKPVTAVRANAFKNKALTSLVIGANVKTIGESAFEGCYNIKSLTLNDKLEVIEARAFYDAGSGKNYSLPSTLKTIGNSAFYSCGTPEELVIPANVETIGAYAFAFSANTKTLIFEEGSKLAEIKANTFQYSGLTSLEVPSNIESIGKEAFTKCWYLESVTLSEGVKYIGIGAFENVGSTLKSFTIPTSVTYIGESAFKNDNSLETITYLGTKDEWREAEKEFHYYWNVYSGINTIACSDGDMYQQS